MDVPPPRLFQAHHVTAAFQLEGGNFDVNNDFKVANQAGTLHGFDVRWRRSIWEL
jgi:hypothetical protein